MAISTCMATYLSIAGIGPILLKPWNNVSDGKEQKVSLEAREIARQSRAHGALTEHPSSQHPHDMAITTICNSSSRESNVLSQLPQALCKRGTQTDIQAKTHTRQIKMSPVAAASENTRGLRAAPR